MQLFLSILSTIGFILLIILAVIAALIVLILFFPIFYKAKIKKTGELYASGSVRWLFGVFTLKFSYELKSFKWSMWLFGIPLHKLLNKEKKPEKKKAEYQPAKKQPTIKPGQTVMDDEGEAEEDADIKALESAENGAKDKKTVDEVLREIKEKNNDKDADKTDEEEPKKSVREKIRFTFNNICDKLKKVKDGLDLFNKIKPVLKKLLKHILPKYVSGYINFGLDDPADTGMLLGIIAALCIPIPRKLRVCPDFSEKRFECDVKLSGRIVIIVLLAYVIKLLKIPEVKALLGLGDKKKQKHRHSKKHKTKKNKGQKRPEHKEAK